MTGQPRMSTVFHVARDYGPRTRIRSVPTTMVPARVPCWFCFTMIGTQWGAAPGVQSGVSPARASSATRIAMQDLSPRMSGIPATVAAITSASSWVCPEGQAGS